MKQSNDQTYHLPVKTKRYILPLLLLLSLSVSSLYAQSDPGNREVVANDMPNEEVLSEIEMKLLSYIEAINNMVIVAKTAPTDSIARLEQAHKSVGVKWNTYYQAMQIDIAANDNLMDLVARYQVADQTLTESIAKLKQESDGLATLKEAEHLIASQGMAYKKLYRDAVAYSLSPKFASKLEKLKSKEQLTFTKIQTLYDKAKADNANNQQVAKRLQKLDNAYIDLKSRSEKIQAAVYKPLLQRFKDELLGIAAVAIVLMFFNMIVSKLQAIKKARAAAKQYQNMLKKNSQYPTI